MFPGAVTTFVPWSIPLYIVFSRGTVAGLCSTTGEGQEWSLWLCRANPWLWPFIPWAQWLETLFLRVWKVGEEVQGRCCFSYTDTLAHQRLDFRPKGFTMDLKVLSIVLWAKERITCHIALCPGRSDLGNPKVPFTEDLVANQLTAFSEYFDIWCCEVYGKLGNLTTVRFLVVQICLLDP